MTCIRLMVAAFLLTLAAPDVAWSDPPAHAPAHGYRAKQQPQQNTPKRDDGEFEIVFDSTRGVQIVVGFPNVIAHAGRFYRHNDGSWQVSARPDAGWKFMALASLPQIVHATQARPSPAKWKGKPGR